MKTKYICAIKTRVLKIRNIKYMIHIWNIYNHKCKNHSPYATHNAISDITIYQRINCSIFDDKNDEKCPINITH